MEKAVIYNIFPTPVLQNNLILSDKEKQSLINIKYEDINQRNALMSCDKYILNNKKFNNLKKQIVKNVDIFTKDVLNLSDKISFYFQNSWVMKHRQGDWAQPHHHANSLISGVVYLKVPDNSGNIVFHRGGATRNFINPIMTLDYSKYNEFNADTFTVNIKENMLVLFPASLSHSVEINNSNQERYCLAFNLFIKGTIGKGIGVCTL